jgi:hypothetical protein
MKNLKIELKWALIFTAMTLTWMVLERVAGLHDRYIDKHMIFTNFIAIPAIAVYVFALLDKRKNFYLGAMTYVQGLVCGLFITLFVTLLAPLTQYITSTVITPDYFKNVIQYVVEHGTMTREAAEANFNLKNYLIQSVIGAPVMGIITSLLVAIFTQKKAQV